MSARRVALEAIAAGDVIFGLGEGGQEKLLFVLAADDRRILARHVTTQVELEFRRDGRSLPTWDGGVCTITSTARLAATDIDTVVGLDRKMRTGKEFGDFFLSEAEVQLLLSVKAFFKANPLPYE